MLKFLSPDQGQAIKLLCLSTVVHSLSHMAGEWGLAPPYWYFKITKGQISSLYMNLTINYNLFYYFI